MITACLRHGTREGFPDPHKVLTWGESSLGKKPEGVGAAGDSPSTPRPGMQFCPRTTIPSSWDPGEAWGRGQQGHDVLGREGCKPDLRELGLGPTRGLRNTQVTWVGRTDGPGPRQLTWSSISHGGSTRKGAQRFDHLDQDDSRNLRDCGAGHWGCWISTETAHE